MLTRNYISRLRINICNVGATWFYPFENNLAIMLVVHNNNMELSVIFSELKERGPKFMCSILLYNFCFSIKIITLLYLTR